MGNESSAPITYGTKLLNDVNIEWKKVEMDAKLPSRDGHCATAMANRLYVFGGVRWLSDIGEATESNEVLVFDTDSHTLSKIVAGGEVPSARSSATMAGVGSKLYVFGGLSRDCGWLNDLYAFDIETKQWENIAYKGTPPSPRDKLTCVAMGTKILFFGGFGPMEDLDTDATEPDQAQFGWFNDLFSFDTENCTWEKLAPSFTGCPTPRAAHGMCAVGSKLVIFGGRDSVGRKNDLYILNTETMEWISTSTTGRQPEPRSFHTCTAVGNRVLVFGGRSLENAHFDDLHIFDTDTKEWLQPSSSGNKPPARGVHTATLVGDQFILYGGSSDFDQETMQCQEYYGDVHLIEKEQLLSGKSQGPDPNDVPPVAVQGLSMASGTANAQECETIEEEDSSEYEESSDEQQ
ncbi:kelch domain-containing protein 1-like [Oculina patagonica]